MIGDNPAARLLNILEEGKNQKQLENCRTVWKRILKIDNKSDSVLMAHLGRMMELPNEIIDILDRDFPNQKGTYSHWSAQVNKAFFQQNLNDNWATFYTHIDNHTLTYLRLNADLIQTKTPTNLIHSEQIKEIREKVSNLLDELLATDLDVDIKKYLTRQLAKLIQVIDEYRISGAVPIMETIESTFGHAFFDDKYKNTLSSTEFGKKIVSILSVVADSMTIALGVPQLPQAMTYYLEFLKST